MSDDTPDDDAIEGDDGEAIGGLSANGDSPPESRPETVGGTNGDSPPDATPADDPPDATPADDDTGSDVAEIPDPTGSGGASDENGDGERPGDAASTPAAGTLESGPGAADEGFVEVQHYRQRWLWASILGVSALAVLTVAVRRPSPLVSAVLLLVPAVGIPGTYLANLRTEVRDDGVYVRLAPLHRSFRTVPFEDVTDHETTTFRAGRDFGGIGIRRTPSGWAYVVTSGDGVRIEREGEPAITIGSERPEELERAITRGIARRRAVVNEGADAPKWQAVADFTGADDAE